MARFFVDRPVFAIVLSILIVLLGGVALQSLPVSQYPEITPPEIVVSATYTGASAVDVEQSVATPLEQQINGVENMLYMKSTNSSAGTMDLRVAFEVGSDLDISNVLVQNRTSQANATLPEDVKKYGVTVKKSLSFPLLLVTLTSPNGSYDNDFLSNYASINITDAVSRIRGVGQVTAFGGSDYAMRVWVRPDRLSQLGLTIPDLARAIQQQSVISPAGRIGGEPAPAGTDLTYTVTTRGRLQTPEEFATVVVRSNPDGSRVLLGDVARMELGSLNYNMVGRLNGKPSAVLSIYQTPGTNALAVADQIKATMAELSTAFPEDIEYEISLDTTLAVNEGISEIVHTLIEAVILVILVVFVFLQNWRATLIPLLTVPVSLIGALAVFPLLGFSVNVLSLLGLVLAIGIVVDDAIVVVEAVMHHIEHGLSPRDATIKAMEEVSGPVVAIALILTAVFVPVAFVPGITGRLYQQFAITIAISVLLSALNALTLSPALSRLLLKPASGGGILGPFYRWFNRVFDRTTSGYIGVTGFLARKLVVSFVLIAGLILLTGLMGKSIPSGFVPEEDQGYGLVAVQLPDSASLQRTDLVAKKIEAILADTEEVEMYTTVLGYSMLSGSAAPNNATFFLTLKDWEERPEIAQRASILMRRLNARFYQEIPEAMVYAFGPPAIPGLGTGAGFSLMVQDRVGSTPQDLEAAVRKFVEAARQRPEIGSASSVFSASAPQLFADLVRDKALKQGVAIADVNQTLAASLGGAYVNDFNRFGRVYKVYVQAEGEYRNVPSDIGSFFVRNANGDMVPLSTLVEVKSSSGPVYTNRFNLYRAAEVNGVPAPGYSSAQSLAALEDVARETLPDGFGYSWNAMSYQERAAEGTAAVVFAFALLCVFLILAAQYESWSLPFSVLLGTPFAAFGAFFGLWAMRFLSPSYENNVFAQIGLIMLIGLAAKNAILIVEFARMKIADGKPVFEAAMEAARIRFRPILMTAFAFILGVTPLVRASGAGAEARKVMGMSVFSGMLIATLLGVLLIPALFVAIERLSGGGRGKKAGAAALALVLLIPSVGCTLGPDYRRPPVDTPESYVQPSSEGASIANVPWWEVFQDPVLEELIRSALANNQDVRAAYWRIEEAMARLGFTQADRWPSFRYQVGASVTDPSDATPPRAGDRFEDYFVSAGVSWEIDLWGRLRRSTEAARAELLATEEGRRAVAISLVSNVAVTYFTLLDLDARLEISQRTLKSREESLRLIRSRFEGGIVSELDLRQAQIEEATAAAAVPAFERARTQAENALSILLGRPPGPLPRGTSLAERELPGAVPAGLPSELLQRRPDVLQAEHVLHAQMARIGVAEALRWPTLALTGSLGVESGELSDLTSGEATFWSLGANLFGPIFEFGKNKRRVEVEKARTEQAVLQYEFTVLQAFREVEDSLVALRTWRAENEARARQVEAAVAAARLSRARYDGGVASYLEVLDTERSQFQAELNAASTRQEAFSALVRLYKALGGGWTEEGGERK